MGDQGSKIEWNTFSIKWLFRLKEFTNFSLQKSELSRSIGLVELTGLGIAAMFGAGIYVVAPDIGRMDSGPAMFISFIIAGVASLLSGLCYSELGARIPRAGSAYTFSYVSVGQFWAFLVGWNLILEYVIGTASVARAMVTYIDVFTNGLLAKTFTQYLPINVPILGTYFDPIAFVITLILTALLIVGVKESTFINNIFVVINLIFSVYIVVAGLCYVDPSYWQLTADQVFNATNSTTNGVGGFMPYGFGGVMTGASAAFYTFVGFDCIASTGEEVANPQRNIPLSIMISLSVCMAFYIFMSVIFTMQTPYYNLSPATLLSRVPGGAETVAVAAILGIVQNSFGMMFPLPRIIYSMADDGLLFAFLGRINTRFKTPLIATIVSGLLTALFAAIFDVSQLVNMLSIGTLVAYSMVAASVLILRYRAAFIDTEMIDEADERTDKPKQVEAEVETADMNLAESKEELVHSPDKDFYEYPASSYVKGFFQCTAYVDKRPTWYTSKLATVIVLLAVVSIFIMTLFAMIQTEVVTLPAWWPFILIGVFFITTLILTIRLYLLPQNLRFKTFKVPFAPLVPILALTINLYLIASLDSATWIRFGVWMIIGLLIYFFYGVWQSGPKLAAHHGIHIENTEETSDQLEQKTLDESNPQKSYGSVIAMLQFKTGEKKE